MTSSKPILLLLALGACAGDDPAAECLARFRQAIAQRDSKAARACVTSASRRFVAKLPDTKGTAPLEVVRRRQPYASRVELVVRDPHPDAQFSEGTFVVVREDGHWRIDLVETAGANLLETTLPGPSKPRFVPMPLTTAQRRAALKSRARRRIPAPR